MIQLSSFYCHRQSHQNAFGGDARPELCLFQYVDDDAIGVFALLEYLRPGQSGPEDRSPVTHRDDDVIAALVHSTAHLFSTSLANLTHGVSIARQNKSAAQTVTGTIMIEAKINPAWYLQPSVPVTLHAHGSTA